MATRDLKENLVQSKYFASSKEIIQEMQDTGTKDMRPLLPFIISGGANTERYYFIHITATTEYKFTIKPEYFADESSYTDVFPQRIQEILNKNNDAKSSVYLIGIPFIVIKQGLQNMQNLKQS